MKMSEQDLLSIIQNYEATCVSNSTGKLAEQRRQAMQYYYGEPYGNEVEGRSQVVTTEVKDAVEEIMPALMKIFTSSDEIVRFEAQRPEDEQQAQQATDYINYIFSRVNNGFVALFCMFKDALLLKNGFIKTYWEEYEDNHRETYEGLTDDEFMSLTQDPELELLEHDEAPAPSLPAGIPLPPGMPIPMVHNAVFRRSKKYGKICIDPVPPEEILVSRNTSNDLTEAQFVEHRTQRTISEVRLMGFDVDDDISDTTEADFNMERAERNVFDDAYTYDVDHGTADKTTREVWLCEAYLYVDFDGDGIAEFRKVTKIGQTILDNEEFDSLPVIGGTAIMMPHKFFGLSIHDLVGDIQLIKSAVTRQLLDNQYIANNGRYEILDNMVNMDDFLTSRPGGGVRVKVLGAIKRMDSPVLGQPAYQLLEYLDKIKQSRTGVIEAQDWMDPNVLNAKATTAEISHNTAAQRIEMMARMLAEGPVKALFWKILELVSKHNTKPQIVKLRGQWVQVDPREWHNKFDMTVTVGLGTGTQQTTMQGAMMVMQIQQQLIAAGLGNVVVTPKNQYVAAVKAAKSVFPKDGAMMFQDPALAQPQPKPPDPELMKIEAKHQSDLIKAQQKDQKMQMDQAEAERQRQFDLILTQMNQKFEADQSRYSALVDQVAQEKQSATDVAQKFVEAQAQAQQNMNDLVSKIRLQDQESKAEREKIMLQGVMDRVLEGQTAFHDHLKMVHEAILAPKEIVRDEKGKAKGVRTVTKSK